MKTYNIINTILDVDGNLHNPLTLNVKVTTYSDSLISVQSETLNSSDVTILLCDFSYEYRIVQDISGLSQNDVEIIAYGNFRTYLDSVFGQENVSEA